MCKEKKKNENIWYEHRLVDQLTDNFHANNNNLTWKIFSILNTEEKFNDKLHFVRMMEKDRKFAHILIEKRKIIDKNLDTTRLRARINIIFTLLSKNIIWNKIK